MVLIVEQFTLTRYRPPPMRTHRDAFGTSSTPFITNKCASYRHPSRPSVAGIVPPYPLLGLTKSAITRPKSAAIKTTRNASLGRTVPLGTNAINLEGYPRERYTNLNEWASPQDYHSAGPVSSISGRPTAVRDRYGMHTLRSMRPMARSRFPNGQTLTTSLNPYGSQPSYGSWPADTLDRQTFYFVRPALPTIRRVPIAINEWMAANTAQRS